MSINLFAQICVGVCDKFSHCSLFDFLQAVQHRLSQIVRVRLCAAAHMCVRMTHKQHHLLFDDLPRDAGTNHC